MFGLESLFHSGINNVSNNISIAVTGLQANQGIPVSITQSTSPEQFWITTGVAVLCGIGIFAIPLVMNKSHPIRKAKATKAFSKLTGRPTLIMDHSKSSLFKPAMIDRKTVTDITRAMSKFQGRDFNLVLNSGGGEVFSSQLISDAMKNYKGRIEIYVPKYAMSGATMLALSGDHIHMNDYSSLGMMDAQVGSMLSQGSAKGWEEVTKIKGARANDNSILFSRVGKQVTQTLQEHVLSLIQNKTTQASLVVNFFTSGDREHIYQVKKAKMLELGFTNIRDILPEENALLCDMVD